MDLTRPVAHKQQRRLVHRNCQMKKAQCFKTTRQRRWLEPRSTIGVLKGETLHRKVRRSKGSKGCPLTYSMHNVPLALGFDQNQPQVAQIESFSVISKGVILKALCTNLMDLRTRICLEYRKRKKRLFCEHN